MIKKLYSLINLIVAVGVIVLIACAIGYLWMRPDEISPVKVIQKKKVMPKGGFVQPPEAYEAVDAPLFDLKFAPMTIQLPDLRRHITYYGQNQRPDVDQATALMHFVINGTRQVVSVLPKKRLYLVYDKEQSPPKYVASVENRPTSLWIEPIPAGKGAKILVGMEDEQGNPIRTPEERAEFIVPKKEYARFGGITWQIGKNRVDGTLLARQRARWYGEDLFFNRHGGEEYKAFQNKQRIDFGDEENRYSVFVNVGTTLVWDEERWRSIKEEEDSRPYPLLLIKKIDDRLMNLELWDVGGRGKITLNLLKTKESWIPKSYYRDFKFVGARTRSQFIFEVNKERMLLSPHDWLLLTNEGWVKLDTPEEIDDYVQRRTTGPLFVFDEVATTDEGQVLIGTLFNATRSASETVELPIQQGGAVGPAQTEREKPPPPRPAHLRPSQYEDDDDDDYDYDYDDDEDDEEYYDEDDDDDDFEEY